MREKLFWALMIFGETIAIVVVVGVEWGVLSTTVMNAVAIAMGPACVALYHLTFVSPYTNSLRERNINLSIFVDELLKIRAEHQGEMRRTRALLNNLTAGTRNRTRKEMGVSFVYFIADRTAGRVKIGISHDPEKRLAALQSANAGKLEIIATIQGDERHETHLHDTFKHLRLNGEWFRLTPEIEQFAIENAE